MMTFLCVAFVYEILLGQLQRLVGEQPGSDVCRCIHNWGIAYLVIAISFCAVPAIISSSHFSLAFFFTFSHTHTLLFLLHQVWTCMCNQECFLILHNRDTLMGKVGLLYVLMHNHTKDHAGPKYKWKHWTVPRARAIDKDPVAFNKTPPSLSFSPWQSHVLAQRYTS